jgi:hypothetical protein
MLLVDGPLWIRAESRHLIRRCCDGLNLVNEVPLLIGDLQQARGDRGHLLDKKSKCVMCLLRGGGHGDENRVGRVGSGRQQCRWWVALNSKMLWFYIARP